MAMDFEEFTDRLTDELGIRLYEHGVNNITIGIKTEEEGRSQQFVTMHLTGEENIVSANLTQTYERFQDGADVMGLASQMQGISRVHSETWSGRGTALWRTTMQ